MSKRLVSLNPDLARLVKRGYAVAFDSGHLIVRDIPYLAGDRSLQWGAIVTKLLYTDADHVIQDDHQVLFAGGVPHEMDGKPIANLGGGAAVLALSAKAQDVIVQRSFSNKPRGTGKFDDFFHKIESYVAIIAGPAMQLHGASPYTFRHVDSADEHPIFKIQDTLTSRAGIGDLSSRLMDDVIAVIGLGGTGAYVLDLLVKAPVREIRGFDADVFHVHNAFRSPGGIDLGEFGTTKADVYRSRYDSFRRGLITEARYIGASSASQLEGVTFAFVCVDKGTARAEIFDLLIANDVPFIDVGMGLDRKGGAITGLVRMTYYPAARADEIRGKQLAPLTDNPDDIYKSNIQIGELNALNACLAVMKYKQVRGFYADGNSPFHVLFDVADLSILGLMPDEDQA